ncbi:MAG: universal stress protein [Gemmatimonadales bacterium]
MLRTIVAATDDSEEGRAAVVAAARLGVRSGATVVVLTVAPGNEKTARNGRLLAGLREGCGRLLEGHNLRPTVEYEVGIGLPGIEITRTAETLQADLVVVGRKRRTSMQRLLVGDTADSVARRSRTPCLFVSSVEGQFERVLVGVDGSERGTSVLPPALGFAHDTGARLRFVTVEPVMEHDLGAPWEHAPRSRKLVDTIEAICHRPGGEEPVCEAMPGDSAPALTIHRGRVVDEILKEVRHSQADVLAIGCHRGGPAGTLEAGSISRRLMHTCHCAVLTIPL